MTALPYADRPGLVARRRDYTRAHTCRECGVVDTDGTHGPPVPVRAQPVEIDVCIPLLSEMWFCMADSKVVWAAYVDHAKQLARRLARIERWKLGLLAWQEPRVWVQLELFGEGR